MERFVILYPCSVVIFSEIYLFLNLMLT